MRSQPTDQNRDLIADFLAEQVVQMSNRGLGSIQMRSNVSESAQALTTGKAARNLLTKARRDLATGNVERADAYLDRALRLPFDEMAEAPTAAHEAHMLLFTTVAEAMEGHAESNSTWLDAAEATLTQCGEHAREDLLQTLRVLDQDHRLPPAERRRIRAIAPARTRTGNVEDVADVGDIVQERAGDDEATQRIVITELLLATTAYQAELDRRDATG